MSDDAIFALLGEMRDAPIAALKKSKGEKGAKAEKGSKKGADDQTWSRKARERMAAGDDAPLSANPAYTRREIMFLAEQEKVLHLDDLFLRRTVLGMTGGVDGALLAEAAAIVGEALGWSADRAQAEIRRTAHLLQDKHGIAADVLRVPTTEAPVALEGQEH